MDVEVVFLVPPISTESNFIPCCDLHFNLIMLTISDHTWQIPVIRRTMISCFNSRYWYFHLSVTLDFGFVRVWVAEKNIKIRTLCPWITNHWFFRIFFWGVLFPCVVLLQTIFNHRIKLDKRISYKKVTCYML